MAIDTATKRRSMFAHGVPSHVVLPVADGTVEAIDQKHFMGLMAVIATQLPIATAAVHIFSTDSLEPNHISDSGNNVLFAGQTEAQGGAFVGGAVNYTQITEDGVVSQESSTGSRPLLRYSLMGV
jgi:hypothetical protein